jgi:hypothetical protein
MSTDPYTPGTEDHCEAEHCRRRRRPQDEVCNRCMDALASMCRGKERVDPYTARKRAERTNRGWYRCICCDRAHQTSHPSGPGASIIRARASRAKQALIDGRGQAWFDQLVLSWDPANGATPRAGQGRSTVSA